MQNTRHLWIFFHVRLCLPATNSTNSANTVSVIVIPAPLHHTQICSRYTSEHHSNGGGGAAPISSGLFTKTEAHLRKKLWVPSVLHLAVRDIPNLFSPESLSAICSFSIATWLPF